VVWIVIGAVGAVIGGLLLPPVRSWLRGRWHAWQEERLLRAMLALAKKENPHENPSNVPVGTRPAADRAKVRDPGPVLDRLAAKHHIAPDPVYPNHWRLTFEGRRRAERPSWWRRMFGT
jgi:hypothetical protein